MEMRKDKYYKSFTVECLNGAERNEWKSHFIFMQVPLLQGRP